MEDDTWHWRFSSPAMASELGAHPEQLLKGGTEAKSNPVRKVIKNQGYFLKFDRRGGRKLCSEWDSAQLVQDEGIPVVEHLALGKSRSGNLLITRELPESQTVGDWFYRNCEEHPGDPEAFLGEFAKFVRTVLASSLYHPDFHTGNILYQPSLNRFVLVDVQGVRKMDWLRRWLWQRSMSGIAMELRPFLSRHRMVRLLGECGIELPEDFYDWALRREARRLRRGWRRRRKQILSGYPKFTFWDDTKLCVVSPLRKPAQLNNVVVEVGNRYDQEYKFLAHFYLQLARIPHRRVLALINHRELLWEKVALDAPPDPAMVDDYQERLAYMKIETTPKDWGRDEFGRTILLNLAVCKRAVSH